MCAVKQHSRFPAQNRKKKTVLFLISETPLAEKSPKLQYGERLKPNSLALARAKNEGKELLPSETRERERERESGGGGKQEW